MKILYYMATLGLVAFTAITFHEMLSSQEQCGDAVMASVKTGPGTNAYAQTKAIDAACARAARNADSAEKVLNRLP